MCKIAKYIDTAHYEMREAGGITTLRTSALRFSQKPNPVYLRISLDELSSIYYKDIFTFKDNRV